MLNGRFTVGVGLVVQGCAWEPPSDSTSEPFGNVLQGTVVFGSSERPSDSFVLLYDAYDPPPPEGTGGPVSLACVPADSFSDGAGTPLGRGGKHSSGVREEQPLEAENT